MGSRQATSLYLTPELRQLLKPLQELTGLSMSDLVAVGLLGLIAQHLDHISHGASSDQVRARMVSELLRVIGPFNVKTLEDEIKRHSGPTVTGGAS